MHEEKEQEKEDKNKEQYIEKSTPPLVKAYIPQVPYLQRLKKQEHDHQYAKCLERFKALHINMTLVECLFQMPKYTKFLKELISNKKKL